MAIRMISCGCCTNGCVCHNHLDIPNGIRPGKCEVHREPRASRMPEHLPTVDPAFLDALREAENHPAFREKAGGRA